MSSISVVLQLLGIFTRVEKITIRWIALSTFRIQPAPDRYPVDYYPVLSGKMVSGTSLKAGFHFNRIVMYRSIFFCVETISSTLVLGNKEIRYVSVRYG